MFLSLDDLWTIQWWEVKYCPTDGMLSLLYILVGSHLFISWHWSRKWCIFGTKVTSKTMQTLAQSDVKHNANSGAKMTSKTMHTLAPKKFQKQCKLWRQSDIKNNANSGAKVTSKTMQTLAPKWRQKQCKLWHQSDVKNNANSGAKMIVVSSRNDHICYGLKKWYIFNFWDIWAHFLRDYRFLIVEI